MLSIDWLNLAFSKKLITELELLKVGFVLGLFRDLLDCKHLSSLYVFAEPNE